MRSKEDAHDYRYFPDPDLPPLVIAPEWVERVRAADAGAAARRWRRASSSDYGLPAYDAAMLTQSPAMARLLRGRCATPAASAKLAANWMMGEVSRRLNAEALDIDATPVRAAQLAALIGRIADGTISNNAARQVFDALWDRRGGDVDARHRGQGPAGR